ncbi:MAG: hypothetical protein C0631_06950 [Sedimenticola sp.]|nr:MAG: hypothetical protein C0631_06950 [Sedimenticola sp.]
MVALSYKVRCHQEKKPESRAPSAQGKIKHKVPLRSLTATVASDCKLQSLFRRQPQAAGI